MSNIRSKVIIPFRDRGIDPRRGANLEVVQAWWYAHGFEPAIIDDGLTTRKDGSEPQFNRHRAYNRAVERFPETEVFIFTEADMLIDPLQVKLAVQYAKDEPGLVVPFTQYRYLSDTMTEVIRDAYHTSDPDSLVEWWKRGSQDERSIFGLTPESTMDNGRSIGAVNVVSRETLDITGGFTEITSGNWYDDRIIEEGFAFLTRGTRYVAGPAVHLYHLPGHAGDHLTREDKAATEHNKLVLTKVRHYIKYGDHEAVRSLLRYRKGVIAR